MKMEKTMMKRLILAMMILGVTGAVPMARADFSPVEQGSEVKPKPKPKKGDPKPPKPPAGPRGGNEE